MVFLKFVLHQVGQLPQALRSCAMTPTGKYLGVEDMSQYKGMDTYLVLKVASKLAVEKEELSFMCDQEKLAATIRKVEQTLDSRLLFQFASHLQQLDLRQEALFFYMRAYEASILYRNGRNYVFHDSLLHIAKMVKIRGDCHADKRAAAEYADRILNYLVAVRNSEEAMSYL
jgi:hypothetical protein